MKTSRRELLAKALVLPGFQVGALNAAGPSLIAHWKLNGDSKDSAGSHHGNATGLAFVEGPDGKPNGAARFDGIGSFIEVPHAHTLRLESDFSVAFWVKVEADVTTVTGDVLSKFDPRRRKGFNLSIAGSSPGYSSVGDAKNFHFGIDNGIIGSWMDCGRPWKSNPLVSMLTTYQGHLYAGTADASRPEDACKVLRYAGGTEWIDCGRLGKNLMTLSVNSMIVHKGRLYAGTGVWDWVKAIAGVAGPNHVYYYEGGKEWRDCGEFGAGHRVLSLASFKGELYAGDDTGRCYRYDGGVKWAYCGQLGNENRLNTMMVYRGNLYGASQGSMFRYDGDTRWTLIGRQPHGTTQVHTLHVYRSRLHAGTWPFGKILRYEGGESWTNCGQVGIATDEYQINEVNDLRVYNGKLYAGVIPKAEVYRYEGGTDWIMLRRLVADAYWAARDESSWRRVPAFTVFQGKLFMGTSNCYGRYDPTGSSEAGRVYAMEAGKNVSYDDDIGSKWRHVVAVRERGRLKLYLDSKLQATSEPFDGSDYDITNREPLRIGLGEQNHFSGALAGVRIYAGALNDTQVAELNRQNS